MDNNTVTNRSLEATLFVNGDDVGQAYRDHWSDFPTWEERGHATEYLLHAGNIGTRLSIDETSLTRGEIYTLLTNNAARGGKGSIVATVKGTRSEDIIRCLRQIPADERAKVEVVTMDFSESMRLAVETAFPKARIAVDHFHIIRLAQEAMQQERIACRKEAMEQQAVEQQQARNSMMLALGMARRNRIRVNLPPPGRLENGDTRVELLARSRYLLFSTPDKWTDSQRQRAGVLFAHYPHIKDVYNLVGRLKAIFRHGKNKTDAARRLIQWYDEVISSRFEHLKVVAETILSRIEHILEYFVDHATNAYAESINSKIKAFRNSLHGVSDPAFFFYRVMRILG